MYDNPRNVISIIPDVPVETSLIQVVGIPPGERGDASFMEPASILIPFQPRREPFIHVPSSYVNSCSAPSTPERFNYLHSPDDLAHCVTCVCRIEGMMVGPVMDEFRISMPPWWPAGSGFRYLGILPPTNLADNAALVDYCRRTVMTIWHCHGGCVAGKVVDGEYRVMGVDGLRVIDGSTFAVSLGTNPQATLMMMGKRACFLHSKLIT